MLCIACGGVLGKCFRNHYYLEKINDEATQMDGTKSNHKCYLLWSMETKVFPWMPYSNIVMSQVSMPSG